jgi:surfeit locus 1 family protein
MNPQASRSRWIIALATLVAVVITASLGAWQLRRGAQKQGLAQALSDRAAMPPLAELPSTRGDEVEASWHRRITLRGRWLPQHTVYLDNRQMSLAEGQKQRVGFEVLTPLALPDGTAIIVQRGWMPRDFMERQKLATVPTPQGEATVEGRYAPPPPRLYEFKVEGAPMSRVRQNLDLDAYSQETGVVLRPGSVIQTVDDASSGVLHRRWTMPDSGVARHHGYAFQWFGLSLLLVGLYVWFQLIQPRCRR